MAFIFFICTLDADRVAKSRHLSKPGNLNRKKPDKASAGYLLIYFGYP